MDLQKIFQHLPASQIAGLVNERLAQRNTLIITAPPGAGKSTLLPLTVLDGLGSEGRILMLEPRRLAARQIAERMASMLGEPVGQTVGYQVRFDRKVSSHTRIEVVTEGILTRRLIADPTLEGISAVIFDEFHERSLNSDFALALTREAQQIIRPDLRILIMSATIDTTQLSAQLQAEVVESQGRMFPVDIQHVLTDIPMQDTQQIAEAVAHQVRLAHQEHTGDILAFLPGEAEIRRCEELLQSAFEATRIFPLYGMLSPQQQRQAIAPCQPGERKVVLSTPIAETSLTIEGVRVVVDSGLCRTLVFDPQSGLSHLKTVRISLDMANQRSGRAGRLSAGTCYRLWSMATEHRMSPCRTPEILDADLSPMMLDVAAWGEAEVQRLCWLTPPPAAHVAEAQRLLTMLHAIDHKGQITPHGRQLAALPCHPRLAQMLVLAQSSQLQSLAADLAAVLEERDPMAGDAALGADINLRIFKLRSLRKQGHMPRGWDRIAQISEQYHQLLHTPADNQAFDPYHVGLLIAAAYPERIANLLHVGTGTYRLAGGEQVKVDPSDDLSAHDWLAVAQVNTQSGREGRIFLASPVHPQDLTDLLWQKDNVSWDSRRGSIVAQRELRIGTLLVESRPLREVDREQIVQVIAQAAVKEGTSIFDFNDQVQNLQRRLAAVSQWHPELLLPDLSTESFLQQAPQWLPLYIGKATTTSELRKIDLCTALWSQLSYDQQQQVDRLAPTHIQVPTGSRIRVEYRQGAELPILRVRLQECFGLTDTPCVDHGQRPVLMELLSPGFKPVQLTQDLKSFWQGAYFEVRKELRRRYPKHSWPDDPLLAEAVRGVKREHK